MTWLSDRSGIASIGVARMADQPAAASASESATTMIRFRSENSKRRLIMGIQQALGGAKRDYTGRLGGPAVHTSTVRSSDSEDGIEEVGIGPLGQRPWIGRHGRLAQCNQRNRRHRLLELQNNG